VKFVIVDDDEVIYHSPLGREKATALENLLRESQCFCPSFDGPDPYSIETYIHEFAWHRTEVTFLLDRNIYSQVIALSRGVPVNAKTRYAAGIIAFASSVNAECEPALALYEGSASGASRGWKRDLGRFHRGEQIHAANWAALALGYASEFTRKLPSRRLPRELLEKFNPAEELGSFEFVYPTILKLAATHVTVGTPDRKMMAFLEWMYRHWYFSAPATILASQVLCSNPIGSAFKHIGSSTRSRALKGVRNAAWDMVYLTEWLKKVRDQESTNSLTVLCSRDSLLLRVAGLLRRSLLGELAIPVLRQAGFGSKVEERYAALLSKLESPERFVVSEPNQLKAYRAQLVEHLEAEILNHNPAS